MKRLTGLIIICVLLLVVSGAANGKTCWEGDYVFDEDGGKTAGGTKIYIVHNLSIKKDKDGNLKAHLYSQGFQTSIDLIASAKVDRDKLHVYFQENGKNHMLSNYNSGDLLFSLQKHEDDGKESILTIWKTFTPALEDNKRSGKAYFEKVIK